MDERRLLMAVALSLVVLTAYSYLFAPPPRPQPSPGTRRPSGPVPATAEAPPPPSVGSVPPSPLRTPEARVTDARERRVEVSGRDIVLAFTNRGARLLSWQLRHFLDGRGRPEEMVQASVTGPRPLDIETGDAELDARLREALFEPSGEGLVIGEREPVTLVFRFSDGEVAAEKELTFQPRGYLVAVRASVRRGGQPLAARLLWGPGVGNPTAAERGVQGYVSPHGVALAGGSVERFPADKLPPTGQPLGGVRWAGVESHYFAALFVPPGEAGAVSLRSAPLPAYDDGKENLGPLVSMDLGLSPGPALLYVGPKDYQEMSRAGHQLARLVVWHMGEWIGPPIVVPLTGLVRWVHSYVGNYGWAIVLVTIMINLVMAPFRHYSIANGMKMSRLAPEMKVIQERYRKVPLMDPKRQQMQEEMGALYAKHGMSMGTQMLVGCLPLLLTMPFLIAFYRVLTVAIELRGAPFLWVNDLSHPDPLFLTPVLMGVSMFAMQKMTPTTMDPAQQRIMMIMPLMFAGMFLWAPAGLNLYWLSSNLCAIAQQGLTLRLLKGHVAAPAAARKRK